MKSIDTSNALLRTIFILIAIAACGYFLFSISAIIVYVISAILLSFVAEPIRTFFQNKLKFGRTLAILSALFLFIFIIFGIILLFVPLILNQSKNLALLDIHSLEKNYSIFITNLNAWLENFGISYKKYFSIQKIAQSFNFNFIKVILNGIIGSIGDFGMALFSIFFICFFILTDQKLITDNLLAVLPKKNRWRIVASLLRIKNMLAKYAIGLLLQSLIVFVMYFIVLLLFKVENAFIIALLGAILNVIPYIGPIIALVMTSFLTMLGHINQDFQTIILPTTLYVICGYFIVQVIDNNFSQPIIFSKSTNSHPLEIFLVTIISGSLLGIVAMIVAIPIYTATKVILKEFYPNNTFIKILTRSL